MLVDAALLVDRALALLDGPQLGDQRLGVVDQAVDGGEDVGDFALLGEGRCWNGQRSHFLPLDTENNRALRQSHSFRCLVLKLPVQIRAST